MQHKPYQAPLLSFFSSGIYKSAAREWGGMSLGYLTLMQLGIAIVYSLYLQMGVANVFGKQIPEFMKQVPEFKVENGQFFTDAEMPYLIKDRETDRILAYIDTRDNAEFPEEAYVKINDKEIIFKSENRSAEPFAFELMPDCNKQKVQELLDLIAVLFVPVSLVVSFLLGMISSIFQILIYGLFGKLMARVMKVQVTYMELVRMSVVAITPVLIIDLCLKMTPQHFPFPYPLAFIIAMGYLFFGVRSLKKSS